MQIKKKLPIVLNILICMPLFILAIVTYIYLAEISVTKSEKSISQLVVAEGRALKSLVEAKKYQVEGLASDERIIEYMIDPKSEDNRANAKKYLKEAIGSQEDYEIIILNAQGDVSLSSSDSDKNLRLRSKESFQKVMQGEESYSDMIFSFVNNDKVVNITVPIESSEGRIIGAVCKVINNTSFSELTTNIEIDKTGYAFIIDERSYVIAYPEEEFEGTLLPSEDLRKEIKKSREKGKVEGTYTYTYNQRQKFVAYYIVEDINWVICIEQSVEEMQRQALVGSVFIVATIGVLIMMVSLASSWLTRQITRPIDLLVDTMSGVSKGDFTRYCEYTGDDEFGTLSTHYNEMLRRLGESHRYLNEVCEELAVTKYELECNYNALEKSQEALIISEERYKTTLNAIEEVIWEYHVTYKYFFATENWDKIVGCEVSNENIGSVIKKLVEPQNVESFMATVKRCLIGEIADFTQEILINKEGEGRWLLCKGHAITNDVGQIEKLIGILTDITYNKENEERVRRLTYFDGLTGCLNKTTFIESLDAWVTSGGDIKEGAVLFVDLDDFKKINDTLSHDIGDKVLNYVGRAFREVLPQDAFIGRFGGDEFVIFKTDIGSIEKLHELVRTLLNMIQNKIIIDENKIHLTCSIGIALYPGDGQDSARLLKNADTAMYKAKENGKNSYSFYTTAMTQTLNRKLLIEEALREAITKNSFYLQYQPVVCAKTSRTVGCEALIRLVDSELGFVSPGEFIPIAEETALIIKAGDWVLENALKELRYYHDQGYESFTMNINVSSIQIREEGFLDKLKCAISKAGVSNKHIKLEVTESVLMENVEESIQLFNEVKEMGIQIALDDFGTGYSSLNYLRSIPLDILKIDKSFIDEIATSKVLSEIVNSIINMAHALDIIVVAEGVENETQLEVLQRKGCDLIQGYYFSKPLGEKELEERLKKENEGN